MVWHYEIVYYNHWYHQSPRPKIVLSYSGISAKHAPMRTFIISHYQVYRDYIFAPGYFFPDASHNGHDDTYNGIAVGVA